GQPRRARPHLELWTSQEAGNGVGRIPAVADVGDVVDPDLRQVLVLERRLFAGEALEVPVVSTRREHRRAQNFAAGPQQLRRIVPAPHRFLPELVSARAHARLSCGSTIRTTVPTPFSLSTSIVPPLSSMLRRAMGSPRPVPVVFVEK